MKRTAVSTSAAGVSFASDSEVGERSPPINTAIDQGIAHLDRLLWPKSVAIVGASADPNSIRGRVFEYLLQREYSGQLYLVSTTQSEVRGQKTYASLRDIGRDV